MAERDGVPLGCIALRPLAAPGEGEVKRLYVRPLARGSGAGEALVAALLGDGANRWLHSAQARFART